MSPAGREALQWPTRMLFIRRRGKSLNLLCTHIRTQEWLKGCRCSKIKCLKQYCVCFRNNILCSGACVCTDCCEFFVCVCALQCVCVSICCAFPVVGLGLRAQRYGCMCVSDIWYLEYPALCVCVVLECKCAACELVGDEVQFSSRIFTVFVY